jgi:hypothetical protein
MRHLGYYLTSGSRTHVRFGFSTHAAAGANVAPNSAFEAADIRIYKATDGAALSATQRSSANGITMTSPFDSLTGVHTVDIDLTDNTDAGFYAAGCYYEVWLCPDETVDSQTITGVLLGYFEIGVPTANVTQLLGTAWLTPGTSGTPDVNVKLISGDATAADNAEAFFDGTGYAGTNNVIPTVTTLTNLPSIPANWLTAAGTAADFSTELRTAINGGDYALQTDASGYVKVSDGTGTGQIDLTSGVVKANTIKWADGDITETYLTLGGNTLPLVMVSGISGDETAADTLELFAEALDQSTGQLDSGSVANGTLTAAAIAADAFTAAKFAADVTTELQSGLATAAELAKVPKSDGTVTWNATALASINAEVDTALADYDGPTHAELVSEINSVQTDVAAVKSDTAAILLDTGTDGVVVASFTTAAKAEIEAEATDALTATVADSIPADGTRPSVASACYMICQGLFEGSISGTTWTVKKTDGSTTLFTVTLDSSTTPTSKTRAT